MLDRSHRFSFKKGAPKRIYVTPLFVVRYDLNNDKLHSAVVVGKKVDKRAVYRNKIKRQINDILREVVSLDIQYNLVLFIKKQIIDTDKDKIKQEIERSLRETHIIK